MGLADTAKLIASLSLEDKFSPAAARIAKNVDKLDRGISGTGTRAFRAGQQIGTGIRNGAILAAGAVGFLATNIGIGLHSLAELETVTTQTNATLKSTKAVAGQTAESIRALAEKYEGLNATIDDKVIQSAENVLLTFTAVRKEAFEPALEAALNLSTAMGQDLQSSVVQIGKALQDPIRGITALRRVGVNFTADQAKVIKKMVETGDVLGAQRLILKELNTEFGGSFLAQGDTTAGKVAKFRDAIEDLQKTLATALLPVIGKVADALQKFLNDPAVVRGAKELGENIAKLFSDKNLAQGAEILKGAFRTAREAAPVVAAAAKTTLSFVQAAVGLFKQLPAPLQTLLVSGFAVNKLTGGLVTNIAGGLISSVLKQLVSGVVNVNGAVVNVNGVAGIPGAIGGAAGAAGGTTGGLLGAAGKLIIPVAIAAITAEAALTLSGINDPTHKNPKTGETFRATNVKSDQLAYLLEGQKKLQERANGGDTFAAKQLVSVTAEIEKLRAELPKATGPGLLDNVYNSIARAISAATGKPLKLLGDTNAETARMGIAIREFAAATSHHLSALQQAFRTGLHGLEKATKSSDVAKFAKQVAAAVTKGAGSATGTKNVLAALKTQLKNTHDPQLQSVLRGAIAQVKAKLPGREFVAHQLKKADQIIDSGRTQAQKIEQLKAIQRGLKASGNTHAAKIVAAQVKTVSATKSVKDATTSGDAKVKSEVARAAAASRRAGVVAAEAIRNKKMSVAVYNSIRTYVSASAVKSAVATSTRLGIQ